MSQIPNPWQKLPKNEPFVLPDDQAIVDEFNHATTDDFKLHLELLPEPFLGRPDAPVVLLNLNPGYKKEDYERHQNPDFKARSRGNLIHSPLAYPFFLLDPDLSTSGYWKRKLGRLTESVGLDVVARNVLCVEYFPYHSKSFRHRRLQLPSQQYGFGLVRQAIDRQATVLLLRSERIWHKAVPELASYPQVYKLNSVQNATVSAKNCPDGFKRIVEVLTGMHSITDVPKQ